jgi:hypothetical protein
MTSVMSLQHLNGVILTDATLCKRYEAEYATFLEECHITMVSLQCQEFNSLVTMHQDIDVEMIGDE